MHVTVFSYVLITEGGTEDTDPLNVSIAAGHLRRTGKEGTEVEIEVAVEVKTEVAGGVGHVTEGEAEIGLHSLPHIQKNM